MCGDQWTKALFSVDAAWIISDPVATALFLVEGAVWRQVTLYIHLLQEKTHFIATQASSLPGESKVKKSPSILVTNVRHFSDSNNTITAMMHPGEP